MLRDIYLDASDEEFVRVSKTLAAIVPKVFKQRSQLVAILKS
jgi:hypothetical protein